MGVESDPTTQLKSVIAALEQERNHLQVVGRALTPAEIDRVDRIGAAVPLLREGLDKLTAKPARAR